MEVSDFTTDRMLSIKYEDKKWKPVAYISKLLNEAKRNYEIHNKEMLAIIKCLETWKHFLEEAKSWFKIWTDYKNSKYFIKAQKLKWKQPI